MYYPDEGRSVVYITNLVARPLTLCGAMNNVPVPQENICYFIRGLMFMFKLPPNRQAELLPAETARIWARVGVSLCVCACVRACCGTLWSEVIVP
jgi:hypothetical protein